MLSVVHGVSAGKKGSMGGECDGNLRQIILKARALCGQGVYGRGSDAAIPVTAQMVGAQRINGNQQHRRAAREAVRIAWRQASGGAKSEENNGDGA